MFKPRHLIEHWGYVATCVSIFLGNLGVPVSEESTLVLAGYFVRQGTSGSLGFSSFESSAQSRVTTSAIGSGVGTGKRP